ncbi:e47d9154-0861-47bc-a90c-3620b71dae40 [Sclerotinia trifoliorum]|uniref:E47d9154-0861-47bc-a90c-3620b71dae40 n=1 Tax=Sclerotinia trifoliorum TaxID=28548 RepID=A0A8H2VZS7_9HELO|nr:e47d9154-0861-47bc-a90c-3620b71dae40 [Sclerotinia trifoliorum]
MASPALDEAEHPQNAEDSDYGSDFSPEEVEIVEKLLLPFHSLNEATEIEDNPIVNEIEYHESERTLRLPRVFGKEQISPLLQAIRAAERVAEQINNSVAKREYYPDLSNQIAGIVPAAFESILTNGVESKTAESAEPVPRDARSPLERFRTAPRKPLSVTDLVSPAWCELQYWYTLTKHGKKKRTSAMKQGSAVHKVLEDQVHRTVQIDIQTREDAWGLQIWNVIQGLRTLRETGQTRELEIWGTIDGLVVNGVIDELSYICPDTELEETLQKKTEREKNLPPSDQASISDFFKAPGAVADATRTRRRARSNKLYICDVKTRGVRTLPNNASFRPTQMQLMLYHHLLSELATNMVNFPALAGRYRLDTAKTFSDAFIAQVGSMNDDNEEMYEDALEEQDNSTPVSSQDSIGVLLAHNNLNALWSLMISEFQITLPDGAESLGKVLKTEYRSRDSGEILGIKTIPMDNQELNSYLEEELRWWKGEREAKGVTVEEAFKCRTCDFAEDCEWRLHKVEEATEKARLRKRRKKSVV